MNNPATDKWYPLRVLYGRELKLKALLSAMQIPNFIPMQYRKVVLKGRETKTLVPAIRNLIFVKAARPLLDELKTQVEERIPFRFIPDKAMANNSPIIIQEKAMEHFIAVSGTMNEQLIYLTRIEAALRGGDKVRVTGGVFAGVEGRVVRIKKDRRVMVSVDGVAAVVTAFINPLLLQRTETKHLNNDQ